MSGDWQCGKSLAECNQYMLDHEINTDVTFIIPNKEDEANTASDHDSVHCKAHKYMLVSRSPVFYAMLCGVMAEQGDILVEDAKQEDFKKLLNYIYTDYIELYFTNVFGILSLSKKYIIPRLSSKCMEYLHRILNPGNACYILDQSLIYEDEMLIQKCLKMIQIYTETVFTSEIMLNIRRETLLKILDCEVLSIKENDVLTACVRLAKHQLQLKQVEATGENIRNVLGDCIHKIGFANMGYWQFGSVVVQLEILSMEEENAIFRYMANKELHPPPKHFLCTKRKRNLPLQIMFTHDIETKIISKMVVTVAVTCDMDIQVESLYVGSCPGNTKIKNIHYYKKPLKVTNKNAFGCRKQEWKLDAAIVLIKGQENALEFEFYNEKDGKQEPVYVAKTSEIVVDDDIVKLKLQSNSSFLPLLGFRCTLVILN